MYVSGSVRSVREQDWVPNTEESGMKLPEEVAGKEHEIRHAGLPHLTGHILSEVLLFIPIVQGADLLQQNSVRLL